MNWLTLSLGYGLFLIAALWLWNRKLYSLLTFFVFATCLVFIVSPFFGIPWACGVGFIFGILLSLLGWWYSAQIVKQEHSQILLAGRLSVSLIIALQIVLAILPIGIWADWRVAFALLVFNSLAWMKAGAVSTDAYVLKRAQEMTQEAPGISAKAAMARAESEMRSNVENPHGATRQELVKFALDQVFAFWAEWDMTPGQLQLRMGSAAYILYCLDLRIGQFFNQDTARRFVADAEPEFARILGLSAKQFSEMYERYGPAFYAVDVWFHKGGPCDRAESYRSMAAAEKMWEIIAVGPDADTSRRSNPNAASQDPGGSLSLLHLQNVAMVIGEMCKNLADKQVRL